MRIWYSNLLDSRRRVANCAGPTIRVGSGPDNEVVLDSPFIPPTALMIAQIEGQWSVQLLAEADCKVGDRELTPGQTVSLHGEETIALFPFTLSLEVAREAPKSPTQLRGTYDEQLARFLQLIHVELLSRAHVEAEQRDDDESLLMIERTLEEVAKLKGILQPALAGLMAHTAGHAVRGELLNNLVAMTKQMAMPEELAGGGWTRMVSAIPDREQDLGNVVLKISTSLNLDGIKELTKQIERVEKGFWTEWDKITGLLHQDFKHYLAMRQLKKEIKDIVYGYGPLEDLLRSPTVSEIMVVDREHIYVEKGGVLENSGRRFVSDKVTAAIIERIVARVGRRIDKSRPLVDARLTDGSRVNAVIPPLALNGPCLTIRKFPARRLHVDDLVTRGSLTRTAASFLRAAVIGRCNILISGGTGTGKTTLLNCLSNFIPDRERIVTIEDTAELQIQKDHVVRLETKEANIEGAGAYTIRDLVKNTLRMRPDRIVVGECRGAEALDMLQAMNTGHDGSLTTIHANTALDVILRLEVLVQMAADLPIASIHRQIVSAIDLVVQLQRLHDGRRCVSEITEFVDIDPYGGGIRTKNLFLLEGEEGNERLRPTGSLPTFMPKLIEAKLIDLNTFYE